MATAATQDASSTNGRQRAAQTADGAPIRCVLEMTADSHIAVILKPGCSITAVQDMLRMLTHCNGSFDHLTVIDDDEDLP